MHLLNRMTGAVECNFRHFAQNRAEIVRTLLEFHGITTMKCSDSMKLHYPSDFSGRLLEHCLHSFPPEEKNTFFDEGVASPGPSGTSGQVGQAGRAQPVRWEPGVPGVGDWLRIAHLARGLPGWIIQ